MATLITIKNAGPGPIMLAGTYLEARESREVTEAQLAAAQADHPDHKEWLHEVSRRTEKDETIDPRTQPSPTVVPPIDPHAAAPPMGTRGADLGVPATTTPERTARAVDPGGATKK